MGDDSGPVAGPGHATSSSTVARIVRDVIAEVAPDELPLVEGLSSADSDWVVRRLTSRRRRRREPLGFGLGEVAVLATPVVWIAVDEVVRRGVDGTVTGIRGRLRRLLRRRAPAPAVPPLTRQQLALVRRRVRQLAAGAGMGHDQAETLADRVVARLALDPSADDHDTA